MRNPPLSLYVHIPWCVQKCPYCDFNSHGVKSAIPEKEYIQHLLDDLARDAELIGNRVIETIFIGGGTPSLFSEQGIADLLLGIKQRVEVKPDAEITMEANPGTMESARFDGYVQAGINRLSVGVQSFQSHHLSVLGRIHDAEQAKRAIKITQGSQLNSFNLDLMHGLPEQSIENALSDLHTAIQLAPPHLSWYQLTIEPNTPFYSKPPELPDDDVLWDIQAKGHDLLKQHGFQQYEISAYSLPGRQCQHNLNYWRFGDYLGIGCGAHGKITHAEQRKIQRTVKVKHPRGYMDLARPYLDQTIDVKQDDLAFEFFMNRFRLVEPCPVEDFEALTGTQLSAGQTAELNKAQEDGLIEITDSHWKVTPKGHRYLNSLLSALV
ncbi:radical SAM family heme chaperone HemW [Alteromonas sp. ASW11-130]|uniref:radical SAM family heme chaperone HemW n=1 Tax=Alteromonas sp. ASW11-130 TaxID=3015775 RepID=UPI00224194FD|nr:radical SAM family heme chaperone HemW [Alteromonas sp. ASW11-130]MCW8092804.1 radical SAM family heme chaperone HemW [Alteromonas sp. ASW11-130]